MEREEIVQELKVLQAEYVERVAKSKTFSDRAREAYDGGWWDGVLKEAEGILWKLNALLVKIGKE